MEILFVCTGNTCRSPMAEGILKDLSYKNNLNIQVYSAGIFALEGDISSNSITALDKIGIDISDYKAKPITNNMLQSADLVLTMSKSHKEYLLHQHPNYEDKIFTLKEYVYKNDEDIMDPYGGDLKLYLEVRNDILKSIMDLLKKEDLI